MLFSSETLQNTSLGNEIGNEITHFRRFSIRAIYSKNHATVTIIVHSNISRYTFALRSSRVLSGIYLQVAKCHTHTMHTIPCRNDSVFVQSRSDVIFSGWPPCRCYLMECAIPSLQARTIFNGPQVISRIPALILDSRIAWFDIFFFITFCSCYLFLIVKLNLLWT